MHRVKLQKVNSAIMRLLQEGIRTTHNRIVLAGLFVGLCYFPVWAEGLIVQTTKGSAGLLLVTAAAYLGLEILWKHRKELAESRVPEEDRLLGHSLILVAVIFFPFCRFAIWPQAILWLIVLVGIGCSLWGLNFFRKYPLPVLLIASSAYPMPGTTAKLVWQLLTPPDLLENFMAWAGSWGLRAIGYPVTVSGKLISLPSGAVEVGWGCNGFTLAFTTATAGLLLGLFLKQSAAKVLGNIVIGVVLALIFNIPRIMLLTIASVHWGKDAFNFWHGSAGGQIFAGTLFTVYYYVVMGLAGQQRVAKIRS